MRGNTPIGCKSRCLRDLCLTYHPNDVALYDALDFRSGIFNYFTFQAEYCHIILSCTVKILDIPSIILDAGVFLVTGRHL